MRMHTARPPLAAAITAGVRHAVFLDANGGAWATGNADASQLGALPPLTPSHLAHQVGSLQVQSLAPPCLSKCLDFRPPSRSLQAATAVLPWIATGDLHAVRTHLSRAVQSA